VADQNVLLNTITNSHNFNFTNIVLPTIDRGIRDTSPQISFEFLFIKTRPPDKLHNGFGFVIQFRVGICYVICQGASFEKKEFKRNLAGSVSYPPVYGSYLKRNRIGYPAQPGLIRPSVRLSVCTYLQIRCSAENGTGPTDSVNYSSKS
jgi:hypothetical protein